MVVIIGRKMVSSDSDLPRSVKVSAASACSTLLYPDTGSNTESSIVVR